MTLGARNSLIDVQPCPPGTTPVFAAFRRKKEKMLEAVKNEYTRRGEPLAAVGWTLAQAKGTMRKNLYKGCC